MENVCYVIMPYGGDDPAKQSKYEGIFRSIISPAAREAGFSDAEIIREDHRGDAGMIIKNIIRHLSSSAVVIADLSGGNANVHYELGIAHVFHKSSTVLICEKGTMLPFDLQSLNVIQYTTDIGAMAYSVEKIRTAIVQRRDEVSAADNSVHEYVPDLPKHLMDLLEADESETQTQLKKLTQENEALKRRLEAAGVVSEGHSSQQSVRSILTAAKARLKYSGDTLLETLRKYADEKDLESFVDYLINAMELGTPTRTDIDGIVDICNKLNNTPLLQDVLSACLLLFPTDSELMTRLAKLYAKRPATRQKAMEMVNSAIGLKRGPDGKYVSVNRAKLRHNDIARFLDTYLSLEAYPGLVEAAKFLLENGAETERDMLLRNIFAAYTRNGDLSEAEEMIEEIKAMGSDFAWYLVSQYYNKRGDVEGEYQAIEKAMIADPTDTDYARILAGHILNEKTIRTPEGIVKTSPAGARRAAAALLYHVVQNNRSNVAEFNRVQGIMSRNQMSEFIPHILSFMRGQVDRISYEGTDVYPLQWCLAQMSDE